MPAGRALGYQQITNLSAAVPIAVPTAATLAVIVAEGASVRYRDDDTSPTAAIGMPLAAGTILMYDVGQFTRLRFIQQAAGAKLNVSFYG